MICSPYLEEFLTEGLLHHAPTAVRLAGNLGIDAAGLEQTVEEYNQLAGAGLGRFGRTPPEAFRLSLYGMKVKATLYHTQGGSKVNTDGQVLRADGSIISNLYAGAVLLSEYPRLAWKAICRATISWPS